jgi:hypothetical protein
LLSGGLGEGGDLTVVGILQFGGRNVTARFIEPLVVEPVHVFQSGELDLLGGAPGPARLDQFGLEQADHGLGQGVVVGVTRRPD